jgi:hypothetical protein
MIDENTIEALPEIADHEAAEPDPDALSSVLGAAIAEIEADGGREANLLKGVIGKAAFAQLPQRQSTAKALDAWLNASPQSKPQATRLLAIAIARAADKPHLVARIEREIADSDVFASKPDAVAPPPKATPVKAQEQKTFPRASTKVGPRDGYLDMLKLATKADATAYIRARAAER